MATSRPRRFLDLFGSASRLGRSKRRQQYRAANGMERRVESLEARALLTGGWEDGSILVGANDGIGVDELNGVMQGVEVQPLGSFGVYQVHLPDNIAVENAVDNYSESGLVRYAEPNYLLEYSAIPNDARFGEQYHWNNTGQTGGALDADVDAAEAWDTSFDSSDIIIAIFDSGADINHEDLDDNLWVNPGEVAGNGIDDDGNGLVDDIHGWDFGGNVADLTDNVPHGSHVIGIAGAEGNNGVGVAGAAWDAQLMMIKIGDNPSIAAAIAGMDYAIENGARVSNHSYGGPSFSQAQLDSIIFAEENDHLFVAAAGNSGFDNDTNDSYPSNYDVDNVVAVAATDDNDELASFSQFGLNTVDIGAPGVGILSTVQGNSYTTLDGTSMASPLVAGAAGLIWAQKPDMTFQEVKDLMLSTVDTHPSLVGKTVSGGRLNLQRAIEAIEEDDNTPETPRLLAPSGVIGDATPTYRWSQAENATFYELQVFEKVSGDVVLDISDITNNSFTDDVPLSENVVYTARVRSSNGEGEFSEYSNELDFEIDLPLPGVSDLISPRGRIEKARPDFTYTAADNAATYRISVFDTNTDKRVIFRDGLTGLSYRHFKDLPAGDYEWYIEAANEIGEYGQRSSALSFEIDIPTSETPIILTPNPGRTGALRPNFTWTNATGAVSYEIRVHNRSTDTRNVIRIADITDTRFRPDEWMDQGTYRVWVRAENSEGVKTKWSGSVTFRIDVFHPTNDAVITSPGEGDTVVTQKPNFTWTTARRATKYQISVINRDQDDREVLRKKVNGLDYTWIKKLSEGNHTVYVRAFNKVGEPSQWSEGVDFNVDVKVPKKLTVTTDPAPSPSGVIGDTTPTFTWNSDAAANRYELIVKDSNGRTLIRNRKIRDNEFTSDIVFEEGDYVATVRGINTANEEGRISNNFNFTVDEATPLTPEIFRPDGNVSSRRPTFAWSNRDADKYQVNIRNLSTNQEQRITVRDGEIFGDEYRWRIEDPLTRGTSYQIFVRAANSQGEWSSWSRPKNFSITASFKHQDGTETLEFTPAPVAESANSAVIVGAAPIEPEQMELVVTELAAFATEVDEVGPAPAATSVETLTENAKVWNEIAWLDAEPEVSVSADDSESNSLTQWAIGAGLAVPLVAGVARRLKERRKKK